MLGILSSHNLIFSQNSEKPAQSLFSSDKWRANFKYFGLTIHPGGGSAGDNPYKLQIDDGGYFVMQIGAETDLDYYINDYFLIRATTALFKDCAFVCSSFFINSIFKGLYHLYGF